MLAFYDLSETNFETSWNESKEQDLQAIKKEVNKNQFLFSLVDDIRILTQLFLDFFEKLAEPAISMRTALILYGICKPFEGKGDKAVNKNGELLGDNKNQKVNIDKNEIMLLIRLRNFFQIFRNLQNEKILEITIVRICTALVKTKSNLEKFFAGRDFCWNDTPKSEMPRIVFLLSRMFEIWLTTKHKQILFNEILVRTSALPRFTSQV